MSFDFAYAGGLLPGFKLENVNLLMSNNEETLYQFPCDFSIKMMGRATEAFETTALTIIRKHAPDLKENAIQTRYSKDKKYLALTITLFAQSKAHLDGIYLELTACKEILLVF